MTTAGQVVGKRRWIGGGGEPGQAGTHKHKLEALSPLTAFSLGDAGVLQEKLVPFITELNTEWPRGQKAEGGFGGRWGRCSPGRCPTPRR